MQPTNALKTISRAKRHREDMKSLGKPTGEDETCDPSWHRCTCKKLDFLGEPVTFNFKGQKNYETVLGALCSTFVVILLTAYFAWAVNLIVVQSPWVTASTI